MQQLWCNSNKFEWFGVTKQISDRETVSCPSLLPKVEICWVHSSDEQSIKIRYQSPCNIASELVFHSLGGYLNVSSV